MTPSTPARILALIAMLGLLVVAPPVVARAASAPAADDVVVAPRHESWEWPVRSPVRLERQFVAPAHAYGPGHRGVDLLPLGDPALRSPAGGVIAFVGDVAGRGVITIDHGDGLVTTLEPVDSDLTAGTPIARGDEVGVLSTGGHVPAGRFHFGVRRDGEYINPLLLLGGVPRAVLLPCC
ncbi:MAG TPA: M23 family metallopeptidase [Microbacterium sp.]|nr:M23 family metallopeptidase [Microbacterium sp.]